MVEGLKSGDGFEYLIQDPDDRCLGKILRRATIAHPERTCLIWNASRHISYGEMDSAVDRVVHGLKNRGVQAGDRVAVMSGNCPEYVFLIFALARLGAVLVTVNVHARGTQLAHILENAEPRLVVVESDILNHVREAVRSAAPAPDVMLVEGDEQGYDTVRMMAAQGHVDHLDHADPEGPRYNDLAQILYTSGTTGPSKGVMITHNQAYAFADYVSQAMELSETDIYYTCLPLFHVNAQISVLGSIMAGACVALSDRFSASRFWSDIAATNATAVSLFGAMAYILYQLPAESDVKTSMRVCWAFPLPYDIKEEFEERYGVRLLTAYASTEANFVAIGGLADELPSGAAGLVHPRFEVKIVDSDDRDLPFGSVGEIVTRPRDPWTMMAGYYRMPEVTAKAFENLWYHTGDAGSLTEDGHLYFVDRIKDVIRRRGENISSYEVEQVVTAHEAVAECVAVGVPSELSEDEVKIVVVPLEGATIVPSELIAWCGERMAYFMVPRFVQTVPELPKTPTGKVEKYRLGNDSSIGVLWDAQSGQPGNPTESVTLQGGVLIELSGHKGS